MTSDRILFACGGAAGRMLTECPLKNIEPFMVNPKEVAISEFIDYTLLSAGNTDAIMGEMEGKRIVFVLAVLGGGSGTDMMDETIECARRCGCKVVSLVGVPMKFEHERRARAMELIPGIIDRSDLCILVDMGEALIKKQREMFKITLDSFFRSSANAMRSAIDTLVWLTDGPFFSTFSARAYTFTVAHEIHPSQAVEKSIEAAVFQTDTSLGSAVIAVSSGFSAALSDKIYEAVVDGIGSIPDIVNRDDADNTKLVIFLPVGLTPSPKVSRS